MFHGSFVAIITPFKEGKIDKEALEKLVEWHISQGTHGIVVGGTTGESLLLEAEEKASIIQHVVNISKKRVPVIAGVLAVGTREAIYQSQQAQQYGADGLLVAAPFYIKPSQEGIYHHYEAINSSVKIPILLYNNPGRASVDIFPTTVQQLARLSNVIGIKDASGDLTRVVLHRQLIQKDFVQLSGNDDTALAFVTQGGQGWISVIANVVPKACSDLYTAWQAREWEKAAILRDWLLPLSRLVYREPSPAPIKAAINLLGFCNEEVRSPLHLVSRELKNEIREWIEQE